MRKILCFFGFHKWKSVNQYTKVCWDCNLMKPIKTLVNYRLLKRYLRNHKTGEGKAYFVIQEGVKDTSSLFYTKYIWKTLTSQRLANSGRIIEEYITYENEKEAREYFDNFRKPLLEDEILEETK